MQFAFDEQQLEFRAQLRAFAEKECPPDALRAAWESEHGWSRRRWRALADMGVVGITIAEEFGGLGVGFVDLVLLLEEAGRSGLPEPLLDAAVGAFLLGGAGDAGAEWLEQVAAGAVVVAVGTPERPLRVRSGADLVVVLRGNELVALEAGELAGTTNRSIDGSRRLVDVESPAGTGSVLTSGDAATALAHAAGDRGALGAAAVLVGAASRLIADTAEYAKHRVQFGKPIGSFQAVKHHLASALVRVEFARPLVYRAAWSVDNADSDASLHCSMAKAAASDAADLAARAALQVHGAIGYTWEHDLHLWMKRVWSLAAAWGDAGQHRALVLSSL